MFIIFIETVPRDFWLQVFYMDQFPPSPWLYHLGRFEFFSKIRGDIRSSRLTTGVEYLREFSKKFKPVLMGYSGAGGKLIHEKKPEAKNLVTLSL